MAYTEKITAQINVNNIDKSAIYKGEKGNYITLTIVPTPKNPYNDYMVKQYIKDKEDPILGNGKDLIFEDKKEESKAAPQQENQDDNDGLPF